MKTREEKLSEIDVRLKRWLARGMRAQTAINKLLKQQARLKKTTVKPDACIEAVDASSPPPFDPVEDDAFTIPAELNRADPLIAERMTAARKKAEEEARHKMPLTGKAALDHIRRKK